MASDTSRPSTENGGSRPPTSRFVEGSMNDRASATPPVHFLEPHQLKNYEKQFYNEPHMHMAQHEARKIRRDRPFSESNMADQADAQDHTIIHRKSTGFFGRVRDALGWNSSSRNGNTQKQDAARKHSSLQEPAQRPQPPAQPEHLRAAKSHSEMYDIPQLPNSGGSRPSRDDVMQSYHQLMATGFFQSHAIQSTRHAGPPSRGNDRRPAPIPMPSIPGSAPCSPQPPPRISSIDATTAPNSPQSPASPVTRGRANHRARTFTKSEPGRESTPMLGTTNEQPPYPTLRGRKRSRLESEDAAGGDAAAGAGAASASAMLSIAQPLKRAAKKLRKMPSSTKDAQVSDGVLHLPPSTSVGGTLYLKERAVRMRSPSPSPSRAAALLGGASSEATEEKPQQHYHHHRRAFSGSSKGEGNRLRKRGKSASLRSRSASGAGFETWEMAGERLSADDGIYQDSTATAGDADADVVSYFSSPGPAPARGVRETTPLSVVPDANRGIPLVPRIPERFTPYHKPRAYQQQQLKHGKHGFERGEKGENARPRPRPELESESEWRFGEAL
ncbi:hypothetical protein GGR54DRAFT_7970 [Hypoxylon sp. NC1633]|nr:hypothetical protein GGR54DRAFT_7970 [Hypoxylon sp. NC1633]